MTRRIIRYRSKIAEAVQRGLAGMHRIGLVDKKTMDNFDLRCSTIVEDISTKDIRQVRERKD